MIVGPAPECPVVAPLALLDGLIVNTSNAPGHQAMGVEFPVLIAVAAEPLSAVIMPFVRKAHGDAVLLTGPQLLDQSIIQFASPFAHEKRFDRRSPLQKLGSVAPAAVRRVGLRHARRFARIPCIFGEADFLPGGIRCKRWQGWTILRQTPVWCSGFAPSDVIQRDARLSARCRFLCIGRAAIIASAAGAGRLGRDARQTTGGEG